ncbi:MAG: LTA synthase family protein [Methylophilaceae bacterium]|nr:LTA synthase family protein [Methylophilaceae bacterium]
MKEERMKNIPSMQENATPAKVVFTVFLVLMALMTWFVLRLGLWLGIGPEELTATESIKTFILGAWFDGWTLVYLVSIFLLVSALISNRLRASKIAHGLRWTVAWFVIFALLFGMVSEYLFWEEFTTRFNFIALDYLIYTTEVIGNIRESYPVPWILATIGMLATMIVWVSSRYIRFQDSPYSWRKRAMLFGLAVFLPLISSMASNVDQTQLAGNAYAQELAANGLFNLASAMRRNDLDYNRFYQTIPQQEARTTLSGLGVKRKEDMRFIQTKLDTDKSALGPFHKRPKNVVLITVESLSASYLGAYGNQENLTPNLDKLASEGLKFERLFATGTRTVRGLEALSLGTPPIPGQAIVRRPNNNHLGTIGEYLEIQGFATEFIYGGYGYFDNMNAYFKGNDFKVIDRTDFDEKSIVMENVWGVADESLFNNALLSLDKVADSNKPFFVQIMTTSNHRPYTFPEGRIDMPQGNRRGAVKYTDYAIGKFIEDAKSKPWFADTLFVIVADHCASVAGRTKLPVAKYHIPMIFYGPALVKPGTYDRLVSQIDVPPTLLDLLGAAGSEHFFGHNMFTETHLPERTFISNYQSLGYYKNDQLIVLSPKQTVEAFHVDSVTYEAKAITADPQLVKEAIAYFQTASNAFKDGGLKELPVVALAPVKTEKALN